ncbi:MAG: hypothetical protein ACFE9Y_13330 [Promethearchaeota archaeon]
MIFDYFDGITEAIEFIIALGSIIGLLGLIIGILGYVLMGRFIRYKMIGVVIVSIILLSVCGLYTGIKYFKIY